MSNFEGATLVPWQVCKEALESFRLRRTENKEEFEELINTLKSETHEYKVFFGLIRRSCTKYELCLSFRDWCLPIESAALLGFCSFEFKNDFMYLNYKGKKIADQVDELTNNGKRDAYLNPEQAAFVNRWANV